MHLLDSNVLIYASKPDGRFLDPWIDGADARISAISIPEVFGFRDLKPQDEQFFEGCFARLHTIPIADAVLWRAATLRTRKRMKLGDSIIAATALIHGLDLVTRNEDDFGGIEGLRVINPFIGGRA